MSNDVECLPNILYNVGKTMSQTTHDWEWFIYTTYKNGDDWGMVYYGVFTHKGFLFDDWMDGRINIGIILGKL